jgi:hypothetical protein
MKATAAAVHESSVTGPSFMQVGESLTSLSDLERLLRCTSSDAHSKISEVLWDAESDVLALSGLQKLANANLKQWEATNDITVDSRVEATASG